MNSEQLLKIGGVANDLGVTTQTLRNWTNSGYMDAVIGKGGHRRFRRSKVERLMELKERESSIKKLQSFYFSFFFYLKIHNSRA